MHEPPSSSPREVLAGLVERVTFHNADSGFCVLRVKARGHRDMITVIGQLTDQLREMKALIPDGLSNTISMRQW